MDREYGQLSTMFYELTKPVGHSIGGDLEYYLNALENTKGRVLEAGVGTGRMLIPLLKNGIAVDGVDASLEMLRQCRINLQNHQLTALLYEQDLVQLDLPHLYDALIMPAGTFCLLPRETIKKTLTIFYNHLTVGGRIIIDLEMPISFQEGKTETSNVALSENLSISLISYSEKIEWWAQRISYINSYELREKDSVIKTENSKLILYWYGISEFELLLSLTGFDDITHVMGYENSQSEVVTFIAYKGEKPNE